MSSPIPTLWFENLDHLPGPLDVAALEEFGFSLPALHDEDEWVLGFRILDADVDAPSIVYVTRRLSAPGVRFALRSAAGASEQTDALHEQIKRFIVDSTRADGAAGLVSGIWAPATQLVLDKADLSELRKGDVALARGYLAERLSYPVDDLLQEGFRGDVQLEMVYSRTPEPSKLIVSIGIQGDPARVRAVVATGDSVVQQVFNTVGMASIPLSLTEESDLISVRLDLRR